MPIWALPDWFELMERHGAKRVVALSSTSLFTKTTSSDRYEREFARGIAYGEQRLVAWAESRQVSWIILRPTLIYGHGRDRNISEIARFIRRFGFFPVAGTACGRRQPVHVDDVGRACSRAIELEHVANTAYAIAGGETLTYREMVLRVFTALGKPPRVVSAPLWFLRGAGAGARLLPRFRGWSPAMAERMNQDQVFDHAAAARDLGFSPRPFRPEASDLP